MTSIPLGVEMRLNNAWVDISSYVRLQDGVTIEHGSRGEGASPDPTTLTMTLDNRDGRFSPRNPEGPYYGMLGRNTPLRAYLTRETSVLELYKDAGGEGTCTTPDSAGLSITGDIDIAIEVEGVPDAAVFKHSTTLTNASYMFLRMVQDDFYGYLRLQWSTTGSTYTNSAISTVPLPHRDGIIAYRVTLDVNNGASGNTVTFYYSDSITGTWTQLGDPVVSSGTTSIANTTAGVTVGLGPVASHTSGAESVNYNPVQSCRVRKVLIKDGIAGTTRANPDFTAQSEGASSFSDGTNTWTVNTPARLTKKEPRGAGEVSEFPSRWTESEADITVPIVASGVTRRLAQGNKLNSPIQEWAERVNLASPGSLLAYWPMEDGPAATSFGSGLPGGTPLAIFGTPEPGTVTPSTSIGSGAIAGVGAGGGSVGSLGLPAATSFSIGFACVIPDAGATDGAELMVFQTAGTAGYWVLTWENTGGIRVRVAQTSLAYLLGIYLDDVTHNFSFTGKSVFVRFRIQNNGADCEYRMQLFGDSSYFGAETVSASQVAQVTSVQVGSTTLGDGVGIGHVMIGTYGSMFTRASEAAFTANTADPFPDRVARAANAAGAGAEIHVSTVSPQEHGPQQAGAALDIIRAAEAASAGGIVCDSLETPGALRVVSRQAIYPDLNGLSEPVVLDYSDGVISNPLDPTDDDQQLRNDVTVTRTPGGSSARAQATTGPLNVSPYPTGIGPYTVDLQLNTYLDGDLPDVANWLLSLGTVDETRYPSLTLDLGTGAAAALEADVSRLRPGSWVTLTGLPDWCAPRDLDLIVLGWTEWIGKVNRRITLNLAPASPFVATTLNSSDYGRLDSTTTTTNEPLDTTETGVDYTGGSWTTTATRPSDFPFDIDIGGEQMTVTSATASTFTVTRSVNGVVKSHSSGATIRVHNPSRVGL